MQMYRNSARFLDREGDERVLLPMQARVSPRVFSVDSRKRDTIAFPNPYRFDYSLDPVGLKGIWSIEVVDVLWAVPANYPDAYVNLIIDEMPIVDEGASTNATAYTPFGYEDPGSSNIKPGIGLPLLKGITLQLRALPEADGFMWWHSDMAGQKAIVFGPFTDKFNKVSVRLADATGRDVTPTGPGAYVKLVVEVPGK